MNNDTTNKQQLKYETTGSKKPKKSGIQVISQMSTSRILWHLTKRHALSLWQVYGVLITAILLYNQF